MIEFIQPNKAIFILSIFLFTGIYSCNNFSKDAAEEPRFGELAQKESSIPIRPGIPGERPFWNTYAKRFIFAPAFDYQAVNGATKYRYKIYSGGDSNIYSFVDQIPYAALSPVWAKIPVGSFHLNVIGFSANNDSLGLAGSGQYYRASPFNPPNGRMYHTPAMSYVKSAKLALQRFMEKDHIKYWLTHKSPDPNFVLYRYPSKIMSAVISACVLYSEILSNGKESNQAKKLATVVADYLLKISAPETAPLPYFPPTYYGYPSFFKPGSHMQHDHTMMTYPAVTGESYLDLYDLTKNNKYLVAAKRIANTYMELQLDNGTWYLFVNNKTGKPVVDNLQTPTNIIRFLRRLKNDYHISGLDTSIKRAVNWIMKNPVKTFNWQGQFEDVKPRPPYENLNKFETCVFGVYLFDNAEHLSLAKNLTRYTEDQFVVWENPRPKPDSTPSFTTALFEPKNWMLPCAVEQYAYWVPIDASVANVIRLYWHAYMATHEKIYLAKAKSLANSITLAQQVYDGDYPTYLFNAKFPLGLNREWLNASVLTIKTMYNFGKYLEENNLVVNTTTKKITTR